MTSLSGLDNITSVGHRLTIYYNQGLTSLAGLDNLIHIGEECRINNNPSLDTIAHLQNLKFIGRHLEIVYNNAVTDILSFNSLYSIGGHMKIQNNNALVTFDAMNSLNRVDFYVYFTDNPSLTTIDGLERLKVIEGNLYISNNDQLTDVLAFDNLKAIKGTLFVNDNLALTSLDGLGNISHTILNNLRVRNNPLLSICNVPSICMFLSKPNNSATISNNTPGCSSVAEVSSGCSSPCLSNGITFTSQSQIDSFAIQYPNCIQIEGDVLIEEGTAGINDLSGLGHLISIEGDLEIKNNSSLADFGGMTNLKHIGDSLIISNNTALVDLAGFDSLSSVYRDLTIRNNPNLAIISGFNEVGILGGLALDNEDSLHSVLGLSDLVMLHKGQLRLRNTTSLSNISGLNNLESISTNLAINNSALTDLSSLNRLTFIGRALNIENNAALVDLTGLNKIPYLYGGVKIINNQALFSLDGLDTLQEIGLTKDFILKDNPSLTNVSALHRLRLISGDLTIENNPSLTDCSGFQRLFIWDDLRIAHNPSLQSLNGFEGLQSLRDLQLINNQSLSDITSLSNIDRIDGQITIQNNSSLTSLSGLENIETDQMTNLTIKNCSNLSFCDVQGICTYLSDSTNAATVSGNAAGCGTREEVELICEDKICTDQLTGISALILDSTSAVVYWDKSPGAGFFKIRYRIKGASSWTLVNVVNKSFQRRYWILKNLAQNTTYEYRILQQCPDFTVGAHSPVYEFTTFSDSPCAIPEKSVIGYTPDPTKVVVMVDYEPYATKYNVRWREIGASIPLSSKVYKNSRVSLSGLTPATEYEYRCRALCSGTWTSYSDWQTFTTNAAPFPIAPRNFQSDFTDINTLVLYPNPTNDVFFIVFGKRPAPRLLRIFNTTGTEVFLVKNVNSTHKINVANFPKGQYFIQFIWENGVIDSAAFIKN